MIKDFTFSFAEKKINAELLVFENIKTFSEDIFIRLDYMFKTSKITAKSRLLQLETEILLLY